MFDDKKHITHGNWSTCCVKKRPTGDEKPALMGYNAFGILVSPNLPLIVYLRDPEWRRENDFKETKEYDSVDAMLADGWIVD